MTPIRIIPRLDIKGPNVVKPVETEALRVVGAPEELARRYAADGADELLYLDIVASLYQRNLDLELFSAVAEEVFVPITAGGGIRTLGDIENVLHRGADKVAINTAAVREPSFLAEAVRTFGAQAIVLSVEAKRRPDGGLPGGRDGLLLPGWEAYTDGGREHTGLDALDWIRRALELGVGEILLTSVDRDGTRRGYDLDLVRAVAAFSPVPVVASGGAGDADAVRQVLAEADAAAVASLLHYGMTTIPALKADLAKSGIVVRR